MLNIAQHSYLFAGAFSPAEQRYPDVFEKGAMLIRVGERLSGSETYMALTRLGLYILHYRYQSRTTFKQGPFKCDYELVKGVMMVIDALPSKNGPKISNMTGMVDALSRLSSDVKEQ